MSRLYDRIINGEDIRRVDYGDLGILSNESKGVHFLPPLADAVVINVDNVASYFRENLASEGGRRSSWAMADFPTIAPPFPLFFMQFRFELEASQRRSTISEWGVVFCASKIPQEGLMLPRALLELPAQGELGSIQADSSETVRIGPSDGLAWEMDTSLFAVHPDGYMMGPILAMKWLLNGNGANYLPNNRALNYLVARSPAHSDTDNWFHMLHYGIYPCFLAIALMHCKNVNIVSNEPPAKLNKARQRHGKQLLARYYTLEIEPMKQILRREGQIETLGLKKALHICRGHFKDYREHGLFGKAKGLYWWDSHVRGKMSEGVVIKDYAVKRPTDKGLR